MNQKLKPALLWVLAIVVTVSSAIYQRSTGPTKPVSFTVEVGDEPYRFSLKRSHVITRDFILKLEDAPSGLEGKVVYRRYPTTEKWTEQDFARTGNDLTARLPLQPPAGKMEYYLVLTAGNQVLEPAANDPVIIRFRGDVPAIFMIPHILFMFVAMLFSNLTGIMVLFKDPAYRRFMKLTFWTLLIGGLILGPVIQNYAFGDLWTGWPLGRDLTDNKTLVAFLIWALALFTNRNPEKPKPGFALLASIVLLLVYFIPHSMMGSELDYSTGEVVTGFMQNPACLIFMQ